jgi:nucleoside-diphosphate-sugar epimerase
MNIFMTGATGYIGRAVAEALQTAGHVVAGAARSDGAARKLESAGVRAIRAALQNTNAIAAAAREADAVVHTGMEWGPHAGEIDRSATDAILGALERTSKPFVYTSGVWVIGSTEGRVAGEAFPLKPIPLVEWRVEVERRVMDAAAQGVRGSVIRPAMVYGRGGGTVGGMMREARDTGRVRVIDGGENHWSFVHVDDLADLYVRALARSQAGELYLAADGPAVKVREVAEAIIAVTGGRVESWTLDEARQALGPMAEGLALDQRVQSTKAGRMLGWAPTRPPVLEDIAAGSNSAA